MMRIQFKVVTVIVDFNKKIAVPALTALLLAVVSLEIGSETLTLSTTYPSPVGIYKFLITTGSGGANTLLARDGGSVGIGSLPGAPVSALQVAGTVTATAFSSASPLLLQTAGTTRIWAGDGTWPTPGAVGIGTTSPAPGVLLDVAGKVHIGGAYIKINGAQASCTLKTTPNAGCPVDTYATWVPGYFAEESEWHADLPEMQYLSTSLGQYSASQIEFWGRPNGDTTPANQDWFSSLGYTGASVVRFFCCPV